MSILTASIAVMLAVQVQYRVAEQEMTSVPFFTTLLSVAVMGTFIWLTNL
ncbi:hypothetical protein HLH44_15215 [Gluconacetobacter sp. 1c LMG 22058]|uniref:Uncharacterized protein n=1 Tax=Gluconacetobacter dulcium TaxID=2729096 RepID=A0A7W4PI16_9PROT|nr:hypothetical protein [Gluconacetobacter dulcium]MBB2198787.1 hypothetical protein [Gluconacetobacter dulcium]